MFHPPTQFSSSIARLHKNYRPQEYANPRSSRINSHHRSSDGPQRANEAARSSIHLVPCDPNSNRRGCNVRRPKAKRRFNRWTGESDSRKTQGIRGRGQRMEIIRGCGQRPLTRELETRPGTFFLLDQPLIWTSFRMHLRFFPMRPWAVHPFRSIFSPQP